ncbi:MAG: hypothetical protein JXR67_03725 [Bacteroidales bacterium]|nr:hypothetical protein [Bacteroidales bacterium]
MNESEGILVLLSGFIYNRPEINSRFNISGKVNDAELACRLFGLLGDDFVKIINGDFSILIYQPLSKKVLLYRDHLGVVPLAYSYDKSSLWFSSDIYALCKVFYSDERYDPEPFLATFRMIDNTVLPVRGVKRVPPAHYATIKEGVVLNHKYWYPEKIYTDNTLDRESLIKEMKDLVSNAVGRRCDPRFNPGAHVSGGLDCGVVSGLARRKYASENPFYGFSWSPASDNDETEDFDERKLVRDHCELNSISAVFSSYDHADCLRYSTTPVNPFYHEQKVQEEAAGRKVNLLFSGYGGDEFISKGDRGIDTDLLFRLDLKSFFARNPLSQPGQLAKTLLYKILLPYLNIPDSSVRKAYNSSSAYLKDSFRASNRDNFRRFYFYKSRRQLHLGFLYCYYLPVRMEYWHISGQRTGIEYRYPLLDKDIVEYVLKVPSRLMFSGRYSRIILREIGEGILPESVRWRTRGSDPVTEKMAKNVAKLCFSDFASQVDIFKENSALSFLDFELLGKAIRNKENNSTVEDIGIPELLTRIKFLHELTKWYRAQ